MSQIELKPNFYTEDTYESNVINDTSKSIDDILELVYFNIRIPLSTGTYRSSQFGTFHIHKNPSSAYDFGAIPFIYYVDDNNTNMQLSIREGANRYGSTCKAQGSELKNWRFYDGRISDVTVTDTESISSHGAVTINYSADNWVGEYGYPFHVTTNLPIFKVSASFNATNELVNKYIRREITAENLLSQYAEVLEIVNKKAQDTEPDGEEFEITNIGTTGTFSEYGASIGSDRYYRFVKGKVVNGKLAIYPISGVDNGILKYGVKLLGELYGCQYSVDGVTWQDTDTFPFDYFYRERTNEIGTFQFALTFSEISTPIFSDEQKAEDFVNDRIGIEESENWNEISRYYKDIVNGTGQSDDTTQFGEVYTRAFFSQQYICDTVAIQQISNGLYDVSQGGFFEKIKKGVEMFGNNPIDSVFSLVFYPFNLNQVFQNTLSQNYVYFGGYKFDLDSTVHKIVFPNGYLDLGTFDLKPTFKNYRDYEPYTKLRVYLPYIGWNQLDIKRYIGKSVKVRYYIDTRTNGTCTACLIADNLLVDYFVGQCGVQFPMTLTDFSSYSNSQLATLLGGGSGVVNDVVGGVSGVISNEKASAPISGMSALSIVGAEVGVTGSIAKSVYQLGQNNINNYNTTKGCSTSMINQYLPQEVLFEFEIQEVDETKNAPSLRGYPSNASGTLNNFTGYLEVQEIDLHCPGATESEKNELISLLNSGVRI